MYRKDILVTLRFKFLKISFFCQMQLLCWHECNTGAPFHFLFLCIPTFAFLLTWVFLGNQKCTLSVLLFWTCSLLLSSNRWLINISIEEMPDSTSLSVLYQNYDVQGTTIDAGMLVGLHVCSQEESEYLLAKMITLSSIPVSFPFIEQIWEWKACDVIE